MNHRLNWSTEARVSAFHRWALSVLIGMGRCNGGYVDCKVDFDAWHRLLKKAERCCRHCSRSADVTDRTAVHGPMRIIARVTLHYYKFRNEVWGCGTSATAVFFGWQS